MSTKRFIEDSFPVKEVSVESAREKNIRQGHISTLHTWWARRPLASSRATAYAALIPAPKTIEEWNEKRNFIIEFSKWENSLRPDLIEKARKDILEANGGVPPKVLDPFAGGGAIPLEALRLGCETYASDLNPVAVLINKCTLEYPQKYGKPEKRKVKITRFGQEVEEEITVNPLLDDVKKWGQWVLEEARKEIGKFYPEEPDGSVPVGYIWARTIPCQNPSCGAEIPLMRQYWLARAKNRKISLFPYIEEKKVIFKVVGTGYEEFPKNFDPEKGNISRAVGICLVCGSVVEDSDTRRLFREGKAGQRMISVVSYNPARTGKSYRIADEKDIQNYYKAEKYLEIKKEQLKNELGIDPIPDEPLPPKDSHRSVGSQLPLYGFKYWGELFNSRQKLMLLSFIDAVRKSHRNLSNETSDIEYANSITSYLALGVDRLADFGSQLCFLNSTGGRGIVHTFGRQALQMSWDYAEGNPFNPEGAGWPTAIEKNNSWIEHASSFIGESIQISQASAISLPFPDNFFDAVMTDPPYYDNVPYSYLSDFFYVWLKRTIGELYPDLFSTPLTPKKDEIVVYANKAGGSTEANIYFESMLKKSFKEICRVLKSSGIATIVYAHKSTEGWETLINSLLDSGLVISASWPVHTEMKGKLNAQETASLMSSIYVVAHKMAHYPTAFYVEVKEELKTYLNQRLQKLWLEGISGADFFIAAIGSAIEVFGKYEKVIDYEGNVIRADRMLQDVRELATDYAVRQILHNGFAGEISDLTRFYVLFRWEYGEAKVQFDEAKKLAMSCGIDLAQEWNKHGFIDKDKEFIRVLGPQMRKMDDVKDGHELIDVLHYVLFLWEKSKRNEILQVLEETGFGKTEAFYRVGQAIAETLLDDSKEKKLLEGFLVGRQRLTNEIAGRVAEAQKQYEIFGKKESKK